MMATVSSGETVVVETRVAVYALEGQSGKQLWRTPCEERMSGMTSLTVAGGRVFCAGETSIWALDLKTGKQLWKVPGVAHRFVLSGKALGCMNELKAIFTAVDAGSGKELWKTPGVEAGVAASDSTFFLAGVGQAFAANAANGKIVWRNTSLSKQTTTTEAYAKGVVVVSTWEGLRGLSESTGKQVWASRDWGGRLGVEGDMAVFAGNPAGGNDGPHRALCLTLSDGKEKWSVADVKERVFVAAGHAVLTVGKEVSVVSLSDGKELWRKPLAGNFVNGLTASKVLLWGRP